LLTWPPMLHAQTHYDPLGTRYTHIAAYSTGFLTPASFASNPAALSGFKSAAFSVQTEKPFLVAGFTTASLHAAIPVHKGGIGAEAYSQHSGAWQEWGLGAAFARSLGSNTAAAVRFRYLQFGTAAYGRSSVLLAGAAFTCQLISGVRAGVQVFNPLQARIVKTAERMPASYSIGLGWEQPAQWMIGVELRQEGLYRPAIVAGCEYVFSRLIRTKLGVDSSLPGMWIGVGTEVARIQIDITVMLHRELGPTPALSMQYSLTKK
jgi:hypothetical protein